MIECLFLNKNYLKFYIFYHFILFIKLILFQEPGYNRIFCFQVFEDFNFYNCEGRQQTARIVCFYFLSVAEVKRRHFSLSHLEIYYYVNVFHLIL